MSKPTYRIEFARMRLNATEGKLLHAMRVTGDRSRARASVLAARLNALSPLATLARGYAVVTGVPDGKTIRSSADADVGRHVSVRLNEGALLCEVLSKSDPT